MDFALNWLTQGVIVAIAAGAALRLIPPSRAQARYGVVWTAYLLVVALPIVPPALAIASNGPRVDLVPAAGPVVTMSATWWTSPAVPIGLWIIWSCAHSVRLALGAFAVRDARRRGRECPLDVLTRLPHWSRVSVSGRRTRVILSGQVRSAAVLGCGTPTIALAPTLIEHLSIADLDRVLVHEWAHVQRRDDLAQLAQRVVRIVAGWHPAVWWLEQQLEFEREAACDEITVRVTRSAKGYAACLATLAGLPEAPVRSVPALAAASPSRLHGRLVRILAAPCVAGAPPWRAITLCGGAGLLACTVAVGSVHVAALTVTSAVASTAPHPLGAEAAISALPLASPSAERTGVPPTPVPAGRGGSGELARPATQEKSLSTGNMDPIEKTSVSPIASIPLQASSWPVGPASIPVVPPPREPPINTPGETAVLAAAVPAEPRTEEEPRAAWTLAADVGVGIGRASQTAGTATAGFFNRFGKKLAGAF